MSVLLLHSPLVGPASWAAVAAELRRRGHTVAVPSLVDAVTGPAPRYPALVEAALVDGPVVVVAHSGAGPLVPALAERTSVTAAVFVDATLPHPGRSWVDTAPLELVSHLNELAGADGVLPPWDAWFPADAVAELLPDERTRAAFAADLPRVPLAYLRESAPPTTLTVPHGYVRLSAGYADVADSVRRAGRPVAVVDGHHLSGVTDPVEVTDAVLAVLEQLT